ncbi:hypothetical protein D915_004430 [Fasciola hepatica]|uniref:Uncharacterized protein n=1 Tax=Fasciola hepatica TaxID=6192 RepID=A0A4E0REX2_FASHE|nr:hypothetical protein D915_004430 [Fasciola hepatica]
MSVDTLQNVESYIRDLAKDRKCRFTENFLDYDKLRLGYVTAGQFFRVIRELIGVALDQKAQEFIRKEYGVNKNDINWRRFVSSIEGKFDENDFIIPPESKLLRTIEAPTVGTKAFHKKPGDDSYDNLRPLLSRISRFIKYQGYVIRECYKQFDIHNVGIITESQFYRSFPGPQDITPAEITALAQRYQSLTTPGCVDYLAFEKDLNDLAAAEDLAKTGINAKDEGSQGTVALEPREDFLRPSFHMIIDRIKFVVHRRGIRVMDFFIDYDKLRHDTITEHQFACALLLAVGKEAQLSRPEVQVVINYYRRKDNPDLIAYRDFCRQIDAPFHILDLEKDPLKQPVTPSRGMLSRGLAKLDEDDEQRVSNLLDKIKSQVAKRRILTYPYFQDYDSGSAMTQVVTPAQFSRVLHFLGLEISSEDCRRLCRKFTDPTSGNVSYRIFCQAIDSWFNNESSVVNQENDVESGRDLEDTVRPAIGETQSGKQVSRCDWSAITEPDLKSAGDNWPVDVLLDRIRHLVLVNRVALKPWFTDFDQLRTGQMTRTQFERCLTAAGLSRLHFHDLTPAQIKTLVEAYVSPNDPKMVNWTKFVEDVDSVFTLPALEMKPMVRVLPQETYLQPKPGTVDWNTVSDEIRENYEHSMATLRRKILERRMLLLPDFEAFDKSHRGYVSPKNFRQLVLMFNFCLKPAEIDAILARHSNDEGFDYRGFLQTLDPQVESEKVYQYPKRLEELRKTNIFGRERKEMEPIIYDTEGVLQQLKAQVFRRRIRLAEWFRDQDQLNHGYMPRITFRRCLGALPLEMNETGLSAIEDRYKGSKPDTVDWKAFCAEVEHVFQTPDLEKDPLKEPETYVPDSMVKQNFLSLEMAKVADRALVKVADKVRQRRLQLLPLFRDFDVTHRYTVSQNQFRRVLMALDLADLITEKEWSCLYCKYRHPLGVVDNINYQAFIDDVYTEAGIDPRVP